MNITKDYIGKKIYMYFHGVLKEWTVVSVKTKYFGICEKVENMERFPKSVLLFERKDSNRAKEWGEFSGCSFYECIKDYNEEIKRRENIVFIRNTYMSFKQTEKIIEILEKEKRDD